MERGTGNLNSSVSLLALCCALWPLLLMVITQTGQVEAGIYAKHNETALDISTPTKTSTVASVMLCAALCENNVGCTLFSSTGANGTQTTTNLVCKLGTNTTAVVSGTTSQVFKKS